MRQTKISFIDDPFGQLLGLMIGILHRDGCCHCFDIAVLFGGEPRQHGVSGVEVVTKEKAR